jgi:hypothetical protein
MFIPLACEAHVVARQKELLREAAADRLARQVPAHPRRQWHLRTRLATLLYALAVRVDPCTSSPATPAMLRGSG